MATSETSRTAEAMSSGPQDLALSWDVQIPLWGYDVRGTETWEFTANISENHPSTVANTFRRTSCAWDGDAADAASIVVYPPAPTERYVLAGLPGLLLLEQGIEP